MAYPDYSEFTFGYVVTRALEKVFGSGKVAPVFPTTKEEEGLGYDLKFQSDYIPFFVQFKRSEVMTRRSCIEIKNKKAKLEIPLLRMNLHKGKDKKYGQHLALQELEAEDNLVFYCTSEFYDKEELDRYYSSDNILKRSAFIMPSEIILPNETEKHFFSFNREESYGYVFSNDPKLVERQFPRFERVQEKIISSFSRSDENILLSLQSLVSRLNEVGFDGIFRQRRNQLEEKNPKGYDIGHSYSSIPVYEQARQLPAFTDFRKIKSPLKRIASEFFYKAETYTFQIAKSEQYK